MMPERRSLSHEPCGETVLEASAAPGQLFNTSTAEAVIFSLGDAGLAIFAPSRITRSRGSDMKWAEAQKLQTEADWAKKDLVWLVMEQDGGRFIARPLTDDGLLPSILIADSLTKLRQLLPLGLLRSDIQPAELPGVVEVWHSP
ncbi:MAG TPA: hypothetical protein VN609_10595 [Propionibacteriaceae bacterium]|nr:hypothetical protein [Propionibacteriaceae bacterium]